MKLKISLTIGILCSLAFGKDIELDARSAKPLPLGLVNVVRKEAGSNCALPKKAAEFSKLFRTGSFEAGQHHIVLVVQASDDCLCSPTGNCDFWVFERSEANYRLLLHTRAKQTFRFLSQSSHGYRDLQTSMHGSAFYSDLTVYRFDGETYRVSRCLSRDYGDGNGNALKKPVIAKRPCR